MKDKKYVVYFEGEYNDYGTRPSVIIKGYYAESQPHYKWSFTEDINKAKHALKDYKLEIVYNF